MDIQKQLAMAAMAKANKGKPMPPQQTTPYKKKPIDTGAAAGSAAKARKAAMAALQAKMGGGGSPSPPKSPPKAAMKLNNSKSKNAAASALASKLTFGGPKVAAVTSGGSGGITNADDEAAAPYVKMMKMRIPEGALRHKMTSDGIPAHVQEYVLSGKAGAAKKPASGGGASSSSGGGGGGGSLSDAEAKQAAPYVKMMKMRIPEGALRHKMNGDGLPSHIQDAVLAGKADPASSGSSNNTASQSSGSSSGGGGGILNAADAKVAAQYVKMMKMKIPEGAVRHKMSSDGVPNHIQDAVLAGKAAAVAAPSSGGGGGGGRKSSGPVSSLSPADEKIATQYRKMMKMKIPEGAVRHKMTSDGVSDDIMKSVLAGEAPAGSDDAGGSSGATQKSGGGNVASLAPSEEAIATPFRKMMKMKIPEGAVRHKMTVERVADHIQKSVLAREEPAPAGAIPESPQRKKRSNPMAGALGAIAGGNFGLKKTPDGEKRATPAPAASSPAAMIAAAAAAAGKRKPADPDAIEKRIAKNKPPSTPVNPASAIAAAAAARSAERGDDIAEKIESQRKLKMEGHQSPTPVKSSVKATLRPTETSPLHIPKSPVPGVKLKPTPKRLAPSPGGKKPVPALFKRKSTRTPTSAQRRTQGNARPSPLQAKIPIAPPPMTETQIETPPVAAPASPSPVSSPAPVPTRAATPRTNSPVTNSPPTKQMEQSKPPAAPLAQVAPRAPIMESRAQEVAPTEAAKQQNVVRNAPAAPAPAPTPAPAPANRNKSKRVPNSQRKKKGAAASNDGAESHCACVVM